jgi:hypothetical protein
MTWLTEENTLKNAKIVAEMLGIPSPRFYKFPYAGTEISWLENPTDEKLRSITVIYDEFCYTKNSTNLPGTWVEQCGEFILYLK